MNNVWGIIGGGFGLYGYLPALSKSSNPVILIHNKNLKFLNSRTELNQYMRFVKGVESYEEMLNTANSLVITTPPQVQEFYINKIEFNQCRYINLILEKPLASNPIIGNCVLKKSIQMAACVRIGYSFNDTVWAQKLRISKEFICAVSVKISWLFYAYHFKNNKDSWKAHHDLGGGVLRFYGIQLLAFLCTINKVTVNESRIFCDETDRPYRWEARLNIFNGPLLDIEIDCKHTTEIFEVKYLNQIFQRKSPFSEEVFEDGDDLRVPLIRKLINSTRHANDEYYDYYFEINNLWSAVELATTWIRLN